MKNRYSKSILLFFFLTLFLYNNYSYALASPPNTVNTKTSNTDTLDDNSVNTNTKNSTTNTLNTSQTINLKGEISVLQIDDFKNPEKSHLEYYINTDNGKYPIHFSSNDDVVSGSIINTKALKINGQFFVDNTKDKIKDINKDTNPNNTLAKSFIRDSIGNQRMLVLLVKPFIEDEEPFTTDKIKQFIFNGQFQNFMKEQSYGKISFSGDVYGWIPYNSPIMDNCIRLSEEQLGNAIDNYKINLSNYDRIVYLIKGNQGGCSLVGKTTLYIKGNKYLLSESSVGIENYDSPSDWGEQSFSWKNLDFLLSHEIGHGLGVSHANAWYCRNTVLYGDCNHVEYGNRFDIMGLGMYSLNYNSYFKEKLGWIDNQQILYITKSGTYTISSLESTSTIKMAKIYIDKPDTNNTVTGVKPLASPKIKNIGDKISPYFIEYRKPIGFDSKLSDKSIIENSKGLFINRVQENDSLSTELLDMSPFIGYTFDQVTLNSTSTKTSVDKFVDNGRGVVIGPILNVSTTSITFNVDIKDPVCERTAPNIKGIHSNNNIFLGDSIVFNIDINNNESYICNDSNFSVILKSPNWKNQPFQFSSVRISPNNNGTAYLMVDIPKDIQPNIYFLSFEIKNNNSGMTKVVEYPIKVKEPLVIDDINPNYGPKGTTVKIKGKGFDNLKGNYVILNNKNGWANYYHIDAINNTITYTIPDKINHCVDTQCNKVITIPIPDGEYRLGIMVDGMYVIKSFYVGFPTGKKPQKPLNIPS